MKDEQGQTHGSLWWIPVMIGILLGAALIPTALNNRPPKAAPSPSGIWAGLVDDLPSGRLVECVFARDPSGSVAVTCDWQNAVRGRP